MGTVIGLAPNRSLVKPLAVEVQVHFRGAFRLDRGHDMRVRFWRRKIVELGIAAGPVQRHDQDWCDATIPDATSKLDPDARARELRVFDDLRIRVFADVAVVGVGIGRVSAMVWELAQFPADCSTVRSSIRTALVRGGCDEARSELVAGQTVGELARLVADATSRRDRRLAGVPAPADLEWKVQRTNYRTSSVSGSYVAEEDSIAVRVEYYIGAGARAMSPRYW